MEIIIILVVLSLFRKPVMAALRKYRNERSNSQKYTDTTYTTHTSSETEGVKQNFNSAFNPQKYMNMNIPKIIKSGVFIILGLIVLTNIFTTIPTGYRGVVTRFGQVTGKVFDEGLHLKVPFVESVQKVNVQIQKEESDASSSSKDLQSVDVTIALNYRISADRVQDLYQEVGKLYVSKIIAPVIQESVKSGTALFTAEELITKRSEVKDAIEEILHTTLEVRGIEVIDVNIVNFTFSEAFDQAIEAKVTAEQEALAAKNKLEQIKFEAQQAVESAKGRAEAIEIEAKALRNNPDVLELRAIEKWNGVLPQVTGGSVPFVNLK